MVVDVNAVISPSMKFATSSADAARTRWPTTNAVAVAARFVVNDLEPVPTANDVALESPA